MNCEQANQMDMVDYLASLGFTPAKITGESYLYLSPLREEATPSLKVNRSKNIWYDHGEGKGGNLVDFVCAYYRCNLTQALQKIEKTPKQEISSFHQRKVTDQLPDYDSGSITILSARSPITDMLLNRYLKQRNISLSVANQFCNEIQYQVSDKRYSAIGFKNNSGGYELRNEYFKGSSSPKYVTYLNNGAKEIACFEGFFDFLTHQTIYLNQERTVNNYLILNSLSFFTRCLLLMEKHDKVHLYFDNDKAGRKCVEEALSRSDKIIDESGLYKGYKDLNEWLVNFGKQQRMEQQPERRHRLRP